MMIIMTTMRFVGLLTCINAAVLDPMQKTKYCVPSVYITLSRTLHICIQIYATRWSCAYCMRKQLHMAKRLNFIIIFIAFTHSHIFLLNLLLVYIVRYPSRSLRLMQAKTNTRTHERARSLTRCAALRPTTTNKNTRTHILIHAYA